MRFRLIHETIYHYASPASESVGELRIFPQDHPDQRVLRRRLSLTPRVPTSEFTDCFGNHVEFFSIPFRHTELKVRVTAQIETNPVGAPDDSARLAVGDARRFYQDRHLELLPFLLPTRMIPLGAILSPIRKRFFRDARPLEDVVRELNEWIFTHFRYQSGVTDVSTPLRTVIEQRTGVCQDFAHLFLSLLRTHGIPARYVSGYIEPNDPTQADSELIGAAASHAWVEVCLPSGKWWGLDPTNNQMAGERHIRTAVGRDYADVAPLRGTYKGADTKELRVIVSLKRDTPAA